MAKAILPIRLGCCLGNLCRMLTDDSYFCLPYFQQVCIVYGSIWMNGLVGLSVWLRQHLNWVNKKKEKCHDSIDTSFAR